MDFKQPKNIFEIKMKMMINTSVYICIFLPSISWAGLYSPLMNDFLEKNFDINEVLIKIQFGSKCQLWIAREKNDSQIKAQLLNRLWVGDTDLKSKIRIFNFRTNLNDHPLSFKTVEFWIVSQIFGRSNAFGMSA